MKYTFDHDFHIHSQISSCSRDPEQNNERILKYAEDEGLHTIVLADHFWDETVPGASKWYAAQDYPHICQAKPLPQSDKVKFLFGCETEMDKNMTVGCSRERMEELAFIVIPTTHFHMEKFTIAEEHLATPQTRAQVWVDKLDALLSMDLPFHKIGIAHLVCGLIWKGDRAKYLETLDSIAEADMHRIFAKAASLGVGIEINMSYPDEERDTVLRPFRIAKEEGCKFYLGSDAHHPAGLDNARKKFERAIDDLELTEEDKFILK
ncbi:MAG: PHP domain-containing protein [Clostridia bacterium]|nr:PHP domain-containing protein [Clostridia bacterium]